MENNKKPQQNYARSKACQSADSSVRKSSSDLQVNKPWPRNTRRREQLSAPRNESQRSSKQYTTVKARPNVDKRPRPRGGGNGNAAGASDDSTPCTPDDVSAAGAGLATLEPLATGALTKKVHQQQQQEYADYELNSVYAPGSKKQNLNHLLNFHYAPRESDYSAGFNVFGRGGSGAAGGMQRHNQGGGAAARKHRYNKEQFLQANFQFVIKANVKPSVTDSPDALIDWHLIEQINIQTTEEPQCPICLYPPIAAKLTRCGHAYCWPCILHYLALSDKTWRKCPICYEAIHTADLKSTTIVQQRQINVGNEITFQLMRRKKGSTYIEKFESNTMPQNGECYPLISGSDESKLFSKLLIAKRADILNIIEREQRELITDEDPTCPEFVFIQQALDLLKERRAKLNEFSSDVDEHEEENDVNLLKKKGENEMKYENTIEIEENIETSQEETVSEISPAESVASSEDSIDDLCVLNNSVVSNSAGNAKTKYYYFYQAEDGQNIYLHPLNVKMLQACYGSLERAPLVITSRVLQREYHSMDEEHRRKFTCLGHLPLTCQFAVMEVDLQPPIVHAGILRLFKEDLLFRKKERQRREREERRREKQINEINDRQMGKLIASAANLNLSSSHEFPSCGFEETLPGFAEQTEINASNSAAMPTPKRQATYSAVAVVGESPEREEFWPTLASPSHHSTNIYQELSTWGKPTGTVGGSNTRRATISDRSSECESIAEVANHDIDTPIAPLRTDLGDVLAMAISQKKQNPAGNGSSAAGNKKHKKTKKMQPLFSTGINYNGN